MKNTMKILRVHAVHHCVHFILHVVPSTYLNIPLIYCNIGLSVHATFLFKKTGFSQMGKTETEVVQ